MTRSDWLKHLITILTPVVTMTCRQCRTRFPLWDPQATNGRDGLCCFCAGWSTAAAVVASAAAGAPADRATTARGAERVRTTIDNGTGEQSPYVFAMVDVNQVALTIRLDYDVSTRAFTGPVVVTRGAGCIYGKVYIGLGPDGTPDTTPHQFSVPFGTTNVSVAQLAANGLNNIDDVLSLQLTGGP